MIEDLRQQLRDNPRLRWGVTLIAGLFWLYAGLLLRDTQQEQAQQHRVSAQTVSRLRAQLAQPEWQDRVAPAQTVAVQLEGRIWQAATAGLAQAAFQDWLGGALARAGATHTQITATVLEETADSVADPDRSPEDAAPTDLWQVRAKLGFDYNTAQLLNFLDQIEGHDKLIVVAALKASQAPPSRVEMELTGYFQKQAVPTAPPRKALVPF